MRDKVFVLAQETIQYIEYVQSERGSSCHFPENMQGMKRSLFKFKMKIVFLSMDNWLEKKEKKNKQCISK